MDFEKLLRDASAAVEGATVITARTPEELFKKIGEFQAQEAGQDAIDEQIQQTAASLTPEDAARYAATAALQANVEHNKGHVDCAKFAQEAAFCWTQISEALRESIEHKWAAEERAAEFESIDRLDETHSSGTDE